MGIHALLHHWPAAMAALLISSTALAAPGPYALSELGEPPGSSSWPAQPYAINNQGVVAGEYRTAVSRRASAPFVSRDGEMAGLGAPLGRVHAGARGINDHNQVVGETNPFDLDSRAFLWRHGHRHVDLGTLGGNWARAEAINNAGTVVGWSATPSWDGHAFAYHDGLMHDIHQLGVDTEARAISPNGTIVGNWRSADLDEHAFIYRDGVMRDLDPQHTSVYANGVNDAGQVVGMGPVAPDHHATLWQNGVMQDLGTLGGTRSEALAINAGGQIVGRSAAPGDHTWHAFIYDEGRMWALAPLVAQGGKGWQLQSARAINDRGQIVGMGMRDGQRRPFLLTPLPAQAAPR